MLFNKKNFFWVFLILLFLFPGCIGKQTEDIVFSGNGEYFTANLALKEVDETHLSYILELVPSKNIIENEFIDRFFYRVDWLHKNAKKEGEEVVLNGHGGLVHVDISHAYISFEENNSPLLLSDGKIISNGMLSLSNKNDMSKKMTIYIKCDKYSDEFELRRAQ